MDEPNERSELQNLRDRVRELESLLLTVNDALFGLSTIISRVIVDADLVNRADLADAIEARAAPSSRDDHNRLLHAFARAVRMNFPGGSFELVVGKDATEVDPD